MTYDEAKAEALRRGIPEQDITPEVLRLIGCELPDPFAGQADPPVRRSPEQVAGDAALLDAEMKSNSIGGTMLAAWERLKPFIGSMIGVVVACAVLALAGCSSQQAIRSVDEAAADVRTLNEAYLGECDTWMGYYRAQETARIEVLYADAVRSVTRQAPVTVRKAKTMVDGKVTEYADVTEMQDVVNPATLQACLDKKLELYAKMEGNLKAWRVRLARINANAANAQATLAGLKAYFQQKAVTFEQANQFADSFLSFMEQFVGKKPAAPAASPFAPVSP